MLNVPDRSRWFNRIAVCAVGLSLSGCVAYDAGYGPGYAGGYGGGYGGGYSAGYYGGSTVNVYAPRYSHAGYRRDPGHDRDRPRGGHNDGGGYHQGGNPGGNHGGGRTEAHNNRQERRQTYGG